MAVRDLGTTGVVRWRYPTQSLTEASNAVSPTGVVVVGTNDDQPLGISSAGRKVWGYDKDEWTYSSSLVRPDGTAYFGDNQGRLTVLASGSGRQVQDQGDREPRTSGIWGAPFVDASGSYYVATPSGWCTGSVPTPSS